MRNSSRQPPRGQLRRQDELQLSIFIRAGDSFAGRPMYHEILDRARRAGLRGATAIRGMQGFGASGNLQGSGLAGLSGHEPVLVEVTDEAARVRAFVSAIDQLPFGGLIVLAPVVALRRVDDVRDIATSATA